ncbi:hypothetical protein O181_001886 [Austropuccinia psidii MF-1]|uniref:Uncharacterized protein n=1 Tax=Austropuccinia psidii MF-1 TaxID=1389203 RepID=A0A9Q3BBZ3_9BASI|nr:hypothetical protein [Austropuccinia psidii MF-1]
MLLQGFDNNILYNQRFNFKVYEMFQEVNMNNYSLNDNGLESGQFSGLQCNENNMANNGPDSNDVNDPNEEHMDSNEMAQQLQTSLICKLNNNVQKTPIHGRRKQVNIQQLSTRLSHQTCNSLSQSSTFTTPSTSRN